MSNEFPKFYEDLSNEELEFRGVTREGLRDRWAERVERDRNSPQVGELAPDFELELLSPKGKRTGEYVALSSLRGKPVGLILGSYT